MTDLLPSTGKPSHDLTASSSGSVALEGSSAPPTSTVAAQRTRLVLDTSVLFAMLVYAIVAWLLSWLLEHQHFDLVEFLGRLPYLPVGIDSHGDWL